MTELTASEDRKPPYPAECATATDNEQMNERTPHHNVIFTGIKAREHVFTLSLQSQTDLNKPSGVHNELLV